MSSEMTNNNQPHGAEDSVEARLGSIVKGFEDTAREWRSTFTTFEEDFEFKLGDQWSKGEKEKMKKRPMVVLNRILKTVKIITGFQTQNFADITVLPEESSDVERAQLYSHVIKWIISKGSNKRHVCDAFSDGVTCGLGWIAVDLLYERDLVNGDITIGHPSPFSIMPDPTFGEPDLSDAQFVYRHAWLTKDQAKIMYPDASAVIDAAEDEDPKDSDTPQSPRKKGAKRVLVIEKWYRTIEERKTCINMETGDVVDVTDLDPAKIEAMFPSARVITKNIPTIKLTTVVKGGGILYDGDHPHKTDEFPFIPVFGYYDSSFNDLTLRMQGIVRALKDPQREKNKRRSQIMQSVLSMPYGGMMYQDGAFDKLTDWEVTKGGIKFLKVNDFSKIKEIKAAELPTSIVSLENMSDQDMVTIGPNPDILGDQMSKSEPGINIQLRQKQGMMAVQEFFDNLSFAKKTLGRYLIKMINANFESEKIAKITGQDVPEDFISSAASVDFDCEVDEIRESQTYKMATFQMLKDLAQQGVQIPPETFVQMADMPEDQRNYALEPMKLQREVQMATMRLQLIQINAQIQQLQNPPQQPMAQQPPAAPAPMVPEQQAPEAPAEPAPEEDEIPPMEEALAQQS